MSVNIIVAGTTYPHPSSAADQNWAAQQVALLQAIAAAVAKGPAVQRLYADAVLVGTGADTTEDVLKQYTVQAGTLSAGKGLRIVGWGNGVSTGDATSVNMYSAANLLLGETLTASQANGWRFQTDLLVVDATHATTWTRFEQAGIVSKADYVTFQSLPFDVSQAQLFKFTGRRLVSSVANSVQQYGMTVELIP